jgi:hypothetical protein
MFQQIGPLADLLDWRDPTGNEGGHSCTVAEAREVASKLCRELTNKRRATKRAAHQAEEVNQLSFKHKGMALTKVSQFPYLGLTLTVTNDDILAVQHNITKAKKKWAEMRRILGSDPFSKDLCPFLQGRGDECAVVQK